MNAIDASSRAGATETGAPPSLLTVILDTNPHAWNLISSTLPLSRALAALLVFLNAHLAINPANRVAVLASHIDRAEWLYPTAERPNYPTKDGATNGDDMAMDVDAENGGNAGLDDANKYRPFAALERALTTNLAALLASTSPSTLTTTTSTLTAGALTLALTYTSRATTPSKVSANQTAQIKSFNYSDPNSTSTTDPTTTGSDATAMPARILVLTLSPDNPAQYIPLMNAIFASQRLSIPLDILPLSPHSTSTFLQQAASTTSGLYIPCTSQLSHAGLLQTLMFGYLPDATSRSDLILPGGEGEGKAVDFRAACFCHRRIVDVGFVCSVCLSIFCEVLEGGECLTCGSGLKVSGLGKVPVVVPKKKAKKKKQGGGTPIPVG